MTASATRDPRSRIFPPALFLAAIAAGLALQWLAPLAFLPAGILRVVGGLLIVGGILLAIWGRNTMVAAGTNIDPGAPATALVTNGPFRYSRNPLYVALTLVCAGVAVIMDTGWILVCLVPALLVLNFVIIRGEEQYLTEKFGEAFRAYCAKVRRYV